MKRRNPPAEVAVAALAPVIPYAVLGVVLYLWGDKILAYLGAKIAGKSTAEFKQDASTIYGAFKAPGAQIGNELTAAKVAVFGYVTPEKAKAMKAATDKKLGIISGVKVPYPNPKSQAEFRANIDAINRAKGWKR